MSTIFTDSTLQPNILIVGYGMVGKATGEILKDFDIADIDFKKNKGIKESYDYYILCLPTPTIEGKQDLSAIEEWLELISKINQDAVVIIRSTILRGTTDKLSEEYNLQIAHVPEFLTEATAIEDSRNPQFLVIGARDILIKEEVEELFLNGRCHPKKIIMTDPTTAELIKYTMNSFFALKVIMGNQLWDIAREIEADYSKLRDVLESHKWGSKNGWDVWHGGFRGFKGHCLPKDLEAFINTFNIPLLKKVKEINDKLLKEK